MMVSDMDERYIASLKQRFACPALSGILVSMRECVTIQAPLRKEDEGPNCVKVQEQTKLAELCHKIKCGSPGKLCSDCLAQGERIDPQLNRIDCFVFDDDRCSFHRQHGRLASRDERFRQSIKDLVQVEGRNCRRECWMLDETGKWEQVPEWHAAMYCLPIPLECDVLPEIDGTIEQGAIFSVKAEVESEFGTWSIKAVKRRKRLIDKVAVSRQLPPLQRPWFECFEASIEHRWVARVDVCPSSILGAASYDEDEIMSAADELKRNGQQECCLAVKRDGLNGKYELLQPEKWLLAARVADVDELALAVIGFESRDEYMFCLAVLNPGRFNDIELARIMKPIKDDYGLTLKELSEHLGRESSSWAGNRLALLKLNPRVQAQMEPTVPVEERITCSEAIKHILPLPMNQQWYEARRLIRNRVF